MSVQVLPIIDPKSVDQSVREQIKRLRGFYCFAIVVLPTFWFQFGFRSGSNPSQYMPVYRHGMNLDKYDAMVRASQDSFFQAEQRLIILRFGLTLVVIGAIFVMYMFAEKRLLERELGHRVSLRSCGRFLP